MEADLSLFHHLDIRDLGRQVDGRFVLTYRMVLVRLRHLPPDSALRQALADGPILSTTDVLLAHNWQASARSKRPHPMLAKAMRDRKKTHTPERARKLADAKRRAQRHRASRGG